MNRATVVNGVSPVLAGRSAVRRRLDEMVDPGSFTEFGSLARHRTTAFGMDQRRPPGDGVVTGLARVAGRSIGLFAQDPSVLGGSLGEIHAGKILRIMTYALRARMPMVGLLDSGGARIQEGIAALDGYGGIFRANVQMSGRVPQISVVVGTCAGGAVYSPALTDIVIMQREHAHMFVTGPRVVKAAMFEEVTSEDLGGAEMHSRRSGVVHLVAADTAEAMSLSRRVLSYLPASCWDPLPVVGTADAEPMPEVPANHRKTYDVRGIVRGIVDSGSFLELQPRFARNLVIGFARIHGRPIGVVANQPQALAGTLDISASGKGARFVRLCDAFGLPLVTLVDTPGFLPGRDQERGGIIRQGAKLLYAFAEATVPRVTIVLRKAFGGAYIVMNSKSLGADAVLAWPGAELAVMGAEGGVDIIFRRELEADPSASKRAEMIAHYRSELMGPTGHAERLSVDEIVDPGQTRHVVSATLDSLIKAVRPEFRHDNLPQ